MCAIITTAEKEMSTRIKVKEDALLSGRNKKFTCMMHKIRPEPSERTMSCQAKHTQACHI
jgi:hypothetical protein